MILMKILMIILIILDDNSDFFYLLKPALPKPPPAAAVLKSEKVQGCVSNSSSFWCQEKKFFLTDYSNSSSSSSNWWLQTDGLQWAAAAADKLFRLLLEAKSIKMSPQNRQWLVKPHVSVRTVTWHPKSVLKQLGCLDKTRLLCFGWKVYIWEC